MKYQLPDHVILATKNPHKAEELRQILKPLGVTLKTALDFETLADVIEDQPTLEGNALKKAKEVAEATGMVAIADDTGLEVKALNGAPGVYSARYAGENATYEDNVRKMLDEMALIPHDKRQAQFRTVIALVDLENGFEKCFEGCCKGQILTHPRGNQGFGYDPIFKADGYELSFAEMDKPEKNNISHRGRALEALKDYLA